MAVTTPVSLLDRLREADFNTPDWGRFVQIYSPVILRWTRGLKLQTQDGEDLTQEALLRLSKSLKTFIRDDKRGRFRDWLRRLVVNLAYEKQRRRRAIPMDLSEGDFYDSAASDPARVFEEADFRQHVVREAMRIMKARLNESTWAAYWQTVAEGRKAWEVGKELGMTEAAVLMAKSRVTHMLRNELKGLLE